MASMVVRNIPEDVMEQLKQRAKDAGISAEQLAREAITEKSTPSRKQLIEMSRELRGRAKPVDLETAQRIASETRAELHARPFVPGIMDDP